MSSRSHLKAILTALLVTFLWASSLVLIKFGLKTGLPAITFAGLRYFLAFVFLSLLVLFKPAQRAALRSISPGTWGKLALLGVLFYTITQGAYFLGLSYLPASAMSLVYNFAPILVALGSTFLIKEPPSIFQWAGILLSIIASLIFFLPLQTTTAGFPGFTAAIAGVCACAASSVLGRHINHKSNLPPLLVTATSMGIGSIILLIVGGITQGFFRLDLSQWLIILWLAIVNTALAFTLWNNTLRTLSAFEASIINNTILPQVAILAWIFLDELLITRQILAIILFMIGTLVVQIRRTLNDDNKPVSEMRS